MPESGAGSGSDRSRASLAALALGTGLGAGYLPWAPGTFGSLLALGLWFLPAFGSPFVLPALVALITPAGAWAARAVAAAVGDRLTPAARWTKKHISGEGHPADPSIVVVDEIAGMWTSLLFLPHGDVPAGIIAFTLFRAFDIVKPPPARSLERIAGGWGIMLDDIAAGAYACIATHLTLAVL